MMHISSIPPSPNPTSRFLLVTIVSFLCVSLGAAVMKGRGSSAGDDFGGGIFSGEVAPVVMTSGYVGFGPFRAACYNSYIESQFVNDVIFKRGSER